MKRRGLLLAGSCAFCLAIRRALALGGRRMHVDQVTGEMVPDNPPEVSAWFQRQTSEWLDRQLNVINGHCCGKSDGHRLDDNQFRVVGAPRNPDPKSPGRDGTGIAYQVQIGGHWLPVMYNQLVRDVEKDPNPTGGAVVWYGGNSLIVSDENPEGVNIYCFAPGTLS